MKKKQNLQSLTKIIKKVFRSLICIGLLLPFSQYCYSQCQGCGLSQEEALAYNGTVEMIDMVEMPMRDGIILNGRIYFPGLAKENLPTILIRSPYIIPKSEFKWFAIEIAALIM